MDARHENLLTINLPMLMKQLDVDAVLPYLQADRVLRDHHVDTIQLPTRTRNERVMTLISTLKRNGPHAFDALCRALASTGQTHVVRTLLGLPDDDDRENLRPKGDPVGQLIRPSSGSGGMSASSSSGSLGASGPPSYEEVLAAQKYYETHLPSFVNEQALNKVPPTSGVMAEIQIEGVDTAPTKLKPLPKFDSADHYHNFANPKGLALIFNNRRFRKMPTRAGTDVDAANMHKLLTELGYVAKIKQDHTAQEMLNALARFALKSELQRADSVVVVVLTHGEHGELFGTDDAAIKISDFTSVLNSNNCPALRGKPKLFFLQACRGKSFDAGDSATEGGDDYADVRQRVLDAGIMSPEQLPACVDCSSVSALQLMIADNLSRDMTDSKELERRIPADADIFIGYATTPGFVSWRNSVRGSWYIESIINVFSRDAYHEDLLSMMTKVNRVVAEVYASSQGGFKQIPEPCSRLTKKFYFFPGRYSPELP